MLLLGLVETHSGDPDGHGEARRDGTTLIVAVAALSFHSILAGAALGASGTDSAMFVLFLALIVHKVAAAFALARLLDQGPLARWTALSLFCAFAIALPAGVALGLFVSNLNETGGIAVPIMLALSAGTILHFGTVHHHLDGKAQGSRTGLPMLGGFALMAVIAIFG